MLLLWSFIRSLNGCVVSLTYWSTHILHFKRLDLQLTLQKLVQCMFFHSDPVYIHEHLSSPPVFWWSPIAHLSSIFCIVLLCDFTFCVVIFVTVSAWKRWLVRLYLQLFVGGRMSYLRYLSLFPFSGVQHILCCIFALFFFVLYTLCCQFLWVVLFWLRYSLTFIH